MSVTFKLNEITIIPDFGSEIEKHVIRFSFQASVPPGQLFVTRREAFLFKCEAPFFITSTRIVLHPIPDIYRKGKASFFDFSKEDHGERLVTRGILREWMKNALLLPACRDETLRTELFSFFSKAWQQIPIFDDLKCSVTAVGSAYSNVAQENVVSKKGGIDADYYVTIKKGLLVEHLDEATNILINM